MTSLEFPSWLQSELDARGWSQADLARETELSTGGVAQLMNSRRNPGPDACTAIARAFGYPPDVVFRAAGILPPGVNLDELTERMIYLAAKLGDYGKHLMIGYLETLVQEEEKKQISELQNAYLTASPDEKRELDRLFDEWKKKKE